LSSLFVELEKFVRCQGETRREVLDLAEEGSEFSADLVDFGFFPAKRK
jgi:hypothetical protein